ncbi:hypothetical protein ACFX1X_028890 [Malus domestica]
MANDAGLNWSVIEDVTLCECWVRISHDPITGNEQKLPQLWKKVHTTFCEKLGNKRTEQSLASRWKKLNKEFISWRNALKQAQDNLLSGENLSDEALQAQVWYNAANKNKSFTRHECWNVVKGCPTYKIVGNGPPVVMNDTSLHSTPKDDSHVQEGDPHEVSEPTHHSLRPLGQDGVTEDATFVHGEPSQDGNGPPKVDSKVEILHEKVTKQIIKEGHGQKPSKYSTCFLHHRAWTESTGHKFEDTWDEQQPLEMILGKEEKEMTGLAIGVSSMKSRERALLHVGWELGYGKEGSLCFPNVPPLADISYEVELIGFDETREGKARSDMTLEERIGAADRRKMHGNALFKEEKLEEAMQQYEMAIAYIGDDFMFQLFGKYRDMALAVKNPCHLNMAACFIKLKRYEEAIGQCSIVLAEDENNVKALFRRERRKAD